MKKKYIVFSILIGLLIIIDQLSKSLIVKLLGIGNSKMIIDGFFKFSCIKNTGISFGLLSGYRIIIILLTILIIGYLLYEFIKYNKSKLFLVSSIMIIGGALGNLIDRIFRGYVVDFISFTIFNKEMAIFNIADILITIGIVLYVIDLIGDKNERSNS
ncbi:MAG: signal peptidase II [Bacilli bacterium]|nr:signal peptidase II [Bacilli bacterium]